MAETFAMYAKEAKQHRGAIMFAVQRGKVAEGIDFSDELCRAVFLIGVPYPSLQDKKIEQKKIFIDKIHQDSTLDFKKINSKEWYS